MNDVDALVTARDQIAERAATKAAEALTECGVLWRDKEIDKLREYIADSILLRFEP